MTSLGRAAWQRPPVLLGVLLAVLLAISACGRDAMPGEHVRVMIVIDGDTFDVRFGDSREERVRMPQIDAPEIDECGYRDASRALADLVLGETVELVATADGPDRDAHGRLLRAVRLNGDDVGERMLRSGMARWVSHYAREDRDLASRYEAAERRAQRESTGLWATCHW